MNDPAEKEDGGYDAEKLEESSETSSIADHTHRTLKSRHVQLIGMGGTIGTSLFVQVGFTMVKGGPGSLLIAFAFWTTVVMAVNNCLSEMVSWIPISSPYIRFSERFVDPAFGVCVGLNCFLMIAVLIPFEITAFNLMLHFWTDKIPIEAVIVFVLVCYACLNVFAVKFYGESEFWLASGKIILALGLMVFTFITMLGGNPQHDVFGFRNWNPSKVPGTPFAEFFKTGTTGRFMGFIACLIQAAFTICGPEYFSMTAGEVVNPRTTLPRAFQTAYLRLATFFIGGALCMGILVPYNDPALVNSLNDPAPGAGSSIYVIAMQNMGINGLSHLVNVLIMLSVFSAGNSYMYCASRCLYGLALEGKAPGSRWLRKCTKDGIPIFCVGVTLAFGFLAFMQVSSGSAKVLGWFVDLVTASTTLNYAYICFTYIRFYQALKYQGIDRNTLPFKGPFQPFCTYYALFFTTVMTFIVGYTVFLPGNWDPPTFVFSYLIIIISPFCYVWYKVANKTRFKRIEEIDLFDAERKLVDEYERSYVEKPARNVAQRVWRRLF